jgi:hypothetical protein
MKDFLKKPTVIAIICAIILFVLICAYITLMKYLPILLILTCFIAFVAYKIKKKLR